MELRPAEYYLERAWRYQADVIAGRIPACKWVRLACQRNDRDQKAAERKRAAFTFDQPAAGRVCQAVELFPHIKGAKAKLVPAGDRWRWQTLELEPWQCWLLCVFFGWKRRATGLRRYRIGLILVPRKNAKSTLTAALGNYLLTADGESGAEVYSAATKRDQARIVFNVARVMAMRSPEFREHFGVVVSAQQMSVEATAAKFEPLSSDANSLDGLNPSGALVDELHAHRTRAVWDVLESALGSREQPVLWAISTAGTQIGGICHELCLYGEKILDGTLRDESFFFINYTIDDADQDRWAEEATWRKANPNYGVSVSPQYLEDRARKAKHTPGSVNNFLTKHLNVWVTAAAPWLSMTDWAACARPGLVWDDLLGAKRCVLAVDMAEKWDIASLVAVAEMPDGLVRVMGKHFLPERAVESSPVAQMRGWVRSGHLIETDGNVHDFKRIEEEIVAVFHQVRAAEVVFDRALAAYLMQNLQARLGQALVLEVPQNVATFNPAMKDVAGLVTARRLEHSGDPVLWWNVSNVGERLTHMEESYPVKAGGKHSPNKIDGAIAMLMALSRVRVPADPDPVYETRGLMVIGEN